MIYGINLFIVYNYVLYNSIISLYIIKYDPLLLLVDNEEEDEE